MKKPTSLPDGLKPPRTFSIDVQDVRRVMWEVPLDARGFYLTVLAAMFDMMEPLPADDSLARMRVGVVDIRVYRRLKARCLECGLLRLDEIGRVTSDAFDQYIADYVREFENRRLAAVVREERLRAERTPCRRVSAERVALSVELRDEVWRKTDGQCVYCGVGLTLISGQGNSFRADHVLPVARGGSNDIGNLVPSCFDCNAKKLAKTALQFLPTEEDGQ